MLVIVGESASGKSTLQKMFIANNPKYKKVVTYTTRPKRKNEKDGVDYHFVSEDKFEKLVKKGFFIEHAKYRDWSYGTAKQDCLNAEYSVAVLTPAGLRALKRVGADVTSIYLYGDYDKKGRQLYWCNTYGGYVTDEAETKNCKIVIGGTMWSEECLSSKNRVEV